MTTNSEATPRDRHALSQSPNIPPGRLGWLVLLGAASDTVPIPFLPARMTSNVRGAIVYDIARRHGMSLSNDARKVLSSIDISPRRARARSILSYAASRALRKVGPLWVLAPTLSAFHSFALGHLFNRYLEESRNQQSIRIESDEALRIRRIIERSLLHVAAPDTLVPREQFPDIPPGIDQRGELTRLMDWALLASASFPAYMLRRLDAAYDRVLRDLDNTKQP